jgi:MFS family permease
VATEPLPAEPAPTEPRRRTFGPVVLLGLASAGLAAAAGNQTLASAAGQSDDLSAAMVSSAQLPLALALALAVLAGWGVLLVLRGRVRRVVAGLVLLGSVGTLVTVIVGHWSVVDALRAELPDGPDQSVSFSGWYWIALVASVVASAAALIAVRDVARWPEMGSKYDAPGTRPVHEAPETPLEIWKAIDEGRDPTL